MDKAKLSQKMGKAVCVLPPGVGLKCRDRSVNIDLGVSHIAHLLGIRGADVRIF